MATLNDDSELQNLIRKAVVEPTGNQVSTADIAVGFRSSTDVDTIVRKILRAIHQRDEARDKASRRDELGLFAQEFIKNESIGSTPSDFIQPEPFIDVDSDVIIAYVDERLEVLNLPAK